MELDGRPARAQDLYGLALTNYGHFTSMRVDGGGVRGLSHHLDRLVRDCRTLFDAELDPDRVRHLLRRALRDVTQPIMARVTIFDPSLPISRAGADAEPRVLVSFRATLPEDSPAPRVASVVYQRDLPRVKHVGLFGPFRHRRTAHRRGFDDVLFVDTAARVQEGATWNVGFVEDDRVVWPEADVLPGVTQALLRKTYPATSRPVTLAELPALAAAFATSAGLGVRPIATIDSVPMAMTHPVLERLREAYSEIPLDLL